LRAKEADACRHSFSCGARAVAVLNVREEFDPDPVGRRTFPAPTRGLLRLLLGFALALFRQLPVRFDEEGPARAINEYGLPFPQRFKSLHAHDARNAQLPSNDGGMAR